MPNNDTKHPVIRCSFCGKSEAMVHKLIEGPGVYICDECIALCNDILAEANRSARKPQNSAKEDFVLPKPEQIKQKLDEYVIGQDDAKRPFQLPFTIIISAYIPPRQTMLNFKKQYFAAWPNRCRQNNACANSCKNT